MGREGAWVWGLGFGVWGLGWSLNRLASAPLLYLERLIIQGVDGAGLPFSGPRSLSPRPIAPLFPSTFFEVCSWF